MARPTPVSDSRRRAHMRRRRLFTVLALAGLALVAAIGPARDAAAGLASHAVFLALSPLAPDIEGFDELPKASIVVANDGTELGAIGQDQRDPVELDDLPDHVVGAVLAAEDSSFYTHAGVDLTGVARATIRNVQGRPLEGGSTVTQQLAKMNYTGSDRSMTRKVLEAMYANSLEQRHSKDKLLERYLNQVYFGQGVHGIGFAARVFFGVPADELTIDQAATLAGKIKSPEGLDPWREPDRVLQRRDQVLGLMAREGWLSRDELAATRSAGLDLVERRPIRHGSQNPHFLEHVAREALTLPALGRTQAARVNSVNRTGGFRIETTLDPAAQDAARGAAGAVLGGPGDPVAGVVSVVPGDGAIRAYMPGLDPSLEFDVVGRGRRQPGSAFKPFVHLALMREGYDPRSRFPARSPMTIDCNGEEWEVTNYDDRSAGTISVGQALVRSVNVVFAQVIAELGPDSVARAAEATGVSRRALDPATCAMSLGGLDEGVTPLEMAAAYATFAANGVYAAPYAITRIIDRDGHVVFERDGPDVRRSVDRDHAGVLNLAMQEVVRRGTGTAADIGRPVAGKTGTTQEHGDAWFVGYVPQLATAVWVGRAQGAVPMTDVHGATVVGGRYPAQIFSEYMRAALADVPAEELYTTSPARLGLRMLRAAQAPVPTARATPAVEPTPEPTPEPSPEPTPEQAPEPEPDPTPPGERGPGQQPPRTPDQHQGGAPQQSPQPDHEGGGDP